MEEEDGMEFVEKKVEDREELDRGKGGVERVGSGKEETKRRRGGGVSQNSQDLQPEQDG